MVWLLAGNRTPDILEACAATFPDADPEALLNAATDHFATVAGADRQVLHGWCLEALRELYRRMVEVGDYKGAIAALKELRRECS